MKKQLLRTLTASILLMSTSVLAEQAPSRTECIAPAKPGGGFDLTCKLIQVSMMETGAIEKPMRVTYMPAALVPWPITLSSLNARLKREPWWPSPAAPC
jgi:putative tricarboxylic transport membrane protein